MDFTEAEIEKEYLRLKNLVTYRKKPDADIRQKAIELLTDRNTQSDLDTMFTSKTELKVARELLDKYTQDYAIESISDKNILREVIYLEVVQRRLQEKLNSYYEKDEKALPLQLIDTIHKNSKAIVELKETLGINKSKDKKQNSFDVVENLKKRFKKWREENQASRTAVCPHCGKMIMFKIRMEAWEIQKHPFFKDRIIANPHLFKMYKSGKITKEDVALVLEVSPDYIDQVLAKLNLT